jgi:predicted dehydrogenase
MGFGRIGAEHAGWLSHCRKISAVAVADATAARRDLARQRGFALHENLDSLLADPSIEAVLISTPNASHCEHTVAALSAGKHVMVEKPMAMDSTQARSMLDAAANNKRVLSVFHNRRWDADFLAVKSAISSGVFGKIINIESRLGQWSSCVGPAAPQFRPNWRNEAAFGGGGLMDWGSHFLDQLAQLMLPSRPLRVFAQLRGNVWSKECDDFARVCIDFEGGAVAMVEINTTTTLPLPRWHIDGTQGSAQSPASPSFDIATWARLDFTPAGEKISRRLPPGDAGLTESQIWDEFASAIIEGSAPAVSAESVLPTMRLLDAARESSRRGIAVEF